MFRQRQIGSAAYTSGQISRIRLPNDAVYHQIQFSVDRGTIVQQFSNATNTGSILAPDFPATLIRSARIIRNGGDVVWQGSGAQLFKEHMYLNNTPPTARIYTEASQVQTLLTQTVNGMVIPANSHGIAVNVARYQDTTAASTDARTVYFDFQCEMWFQLPLEGKAAVNTLVDARKLATFDLEITWAQTTEVFTLGTANSSSAITCTLNVLSSDQDAVALDNDFGTFKRTGFDYSQFPVGSSSQQIQLSRGNLWLGMIISTQKYLNGGSTTIPNYDSNILGNIQNRINTSYQLRIHTFQQLANKNFSDNGGRHLPHAVHGIAPTGWAAIEYAAQLDNAGELIQSYVADMFDLLVDVNAAASQTNGVPATGNPIIKLLTQEVIPGRTTSSQPGLQNGSTTATSAKPFVK